MLPSGYISASGLYATNGAYIDTGVYPSNTLTVDALFGKATNAYVFGARNTNSNTSQGQLNFYCGQQGGVSYVGYYNTRISLSTQLTDVVGTQIHFHSESNEFIVNDNNAVKEATGSTTTFNGTRTIHLYGLNNAGTHQSGAVCINGIKIWDNGSLVRCFEPCYNGTNYGMYDSANSVFYSLQSVRNLYLVNIGTASGGEGFIETLFNYNVKQQYCGASTNYDLARIKAVPQEGYVFLRWEDSDGNFITSENEYEYSATQDITLVPVFAKKTSDDFKTGFKAMALLFGKNERDVTSSLRDDIYANVLSASVKVDALQRCSTTLELESVPTSYQLNMPLFLFDSKGKIIYYGVIKNITGTTVECREPLSIYDNDFLFHPNTNIYDNRNMTNYSVLSTLYFYMYMARNTVSDTETSLDWLATRQHGQIIPRRNTKMFLDMNRNFSIPTQATADIRVGNLEDYLISLFSDFNVYAKAYLKEGNFTWTGVTFQKHYMELVPSYAEEMESITISDNVETIANVNITTMEAENTYLYIYDSSGSTLRAGYGMKTDGSIISYSPYSGENPNLVAYNLYKPKIVTSDENMRYLSTQNLSNALYNHKISFDLYLGGMITLDDIKIGRRVMFYYKNTAYSSIITGYEFSMGINSNGIQVVSVTLGKVRTSLTSKLNLGKVK